MKSTNQHFYWLFILFELFINYSFAQKSYDNLEYKYVSGTNKLDYVKDAVSATTYTDDIDNQSASNYAYDSNGQLIKDAAEGILDIDWTTSGKIKKISLDDGTDGIADRTLEYKYDGAGNRVKKIETAGASITTTYYIRTAGGNLISTYTNKGSGTSRDQIMLLNGVDNVTSSISTTGVYTRKVGYKNYELKDLLSNVRVVVNDVKEPVSGKSTFTANIKYVTDYYSYGALLPGRNSISGYRFAFQGKEKDDEIKGNGDSYDFGARIYDPRLGRWLSIDPLGETTPQRSPYNGMGNNPVLMKDGNGMKEYASYQDYVASFPRESINSASPLLRFFGPKSEAEWDGSDGNWLASDRENNTTRYQIGMATTAADWAASQFLPTANNATATQLWFEFRQGMGPEYRVFTATDIDAKEAQASIDQVNPMMSHDINTSKPIITTDQSIVDMMAASPAVEKGLAQFYAANAASEGGELIEATARYNFTPNEITPSSLYESAEAHANTAFGANGGALRLFTGSCGVIVTPVEGGEYLQITLYNVTSRNSLFVHQMPDGNRQREAGKRIEMSNTGQVYIFKVPVDHMRLYDAQLNSGENNAKK